MEYELYLDVQLMTDLGMNLLLLLLTAKLLKTTVTFRRLIAASAFGAVSHTALIVLWVQVGWKAPPLVSLAAAVAILKIAFPIKRLQMLGMAMAAFYGSAFLLSGAMQYLNPGQKKMFLSFLLTAAASYGILLIFYRVWCMYRRKNGNIHRVRLYIGDKMYDLKGLVDTGNSLVDPWFHKPVSIVEQSVLGAVDEECLQKLKLHMIPYNSIGKQNGVLMGIVISRMVIEGNQGERTVEEPVLALCRERVSSDGRYQMILHEEYMPD